MSENIVNEPAAQTTQEAVAPQDVKAVTSDFNLLDRVSDEYKPLVESKGFKDVNEIVKSYSNLEKLVGNSVRVPPQDASIESKQEFYKKIAGDENIIIKPAQDAEDKSAYYTKLGRPESSEGYELREAIDKDMFSVVPGLEGELEGFRNTAYEIGLSKAQAKSIVDMRMEMVKNSLEKHEIGKKEAEDVLHELWGRDFDNRLMAAKNVGKIYSEKHPEAMQELINGPAGNNPAFLSMLAELGSSFKEKGHTGMQTAKFGTSPEDAVSKIRDKRADIGFMKAYHDDSHPGHKKAVSDLSELYNIANSES